MRKHFLAALACALLAFAGAASGQGFRTFVVKDIRVEGLQRTEPGTVFSYLPVKVGETMNEEKAQQALRALFATGFFRDVRLEAEGDVLVILVEERPAVAQIDLVGIKEFETAAVKRILRDAGLAEGRTFDRSILDFAEQELKRQYLSRGRYSAEVQTTVTPLERNRVGISLSVNEGDVAKIRSINIVGSQVFEEKTLLEQFGLRTPGWLTWYTKADQYSKTKLTGDIESLKSFYLNRGYIEMNIESTQVSITPDKKDIYITINITEGEQYKVSGIKFEGETFGREEELRSLVLLRPGETYSGARLTATNKLISDRLGTFGYAFANVNANPDIDRDKREVSFTFFIDPGKRAYVRHMNIAGNTVTRDEVIRREFRQFESSWYDANKIKLSRDRVDRLGYFKDVTVDTPEAQGTSDQVDVNLTVVEKPTGNFQIGGAFDFQVVRLFAAFAREENLFNPATNISGTTNGAGAKSYMVGATAPLGNGLLRGSFQSRDGDERAGEDRDVQVATLAYEYSLSKRTMLYTAFSKSDGRGTLNNNPTYDKKVFSLGVLHSF